MNLSIAGSELEYFHVCAFFNSRDEEYDVLGPFYKEGVDQGEKILNIIDPTLAEEHRARLRSAGIDTTKCEACGTLDVLGWRDAYLNEQGEFDKDRMLGVVEQLTTIGEDAGYKRLRIMGNMNWTLGDVPGTERIIEYEAEVNDVLARKRQPAVCVYDIAKLTAATMMDLLRTHPLTLVGGVVHENPFYTPPHEMLKELRARASAGAGAGAAAGA